MYKLFMIFLFSTMLNANAGNYDIRFKGIKLGEIENLDSLKDGYLKAEVTSRIARFFIGHDYFVFYGGDKPAIDDAKYRKDKNMIVFAFYQSIVEKPKHKVYNISSVKSLTLDCSDNECKYFYRKKN